MVWTERRSDIDLFGTQVTTGGATVGTRGFAITTARGDQDTPQVAGNGNFLVVWTDRRSGGLDVFGTRVGPAGRVLDGNGYAIAASPTDEQEPAVSAGRNGDDPFAIAYRRFAPESPLGAEQLRLLCEQAGLTRALEMFPEGVKAAAERGLKPLGDHPRITPVSSPAGMPRR